MIQIKHRYTGAVLFEAAVDSIKLAVELAVSKNADLRGADLRGADLRGAYLRDADLGGAYLRGANLGATCLIDGGQRSDGYRFIGWSKDDVLQIRAGCRNFTITKARKHWSSDDYRDRKLGDETLCILDHIERVAVIRGLTERAV